MLAVVVAVTVFVVDVQVSAGVALSMLYVWSVLLALRSGNMKAVVVLASLISALTVLGLPLKPPSGILWIGVVNRCLSITLVWTLVVSELRRRRAEAGRVKALMDRNAALEQLKVMRGLVPICAWCKCIRDDQGYWKQLEDYIAQHSEAQFTHGMCPACFSRMRSRPPAAKK